MLFIGEVAKRSGLGIETVRFYEREGLIPIPDRSTAGYRCYPETVVIRLRFIQHAKALGFSLTEIGELIALKDTPDSDCSRMRTNALAKMAKIQHKIDALEKMKAALTPLIEQCQSAKSIHDCPILSALENDIASPFSD